VRPTPQVAQSDDEIKLDALVQRRRQLLDLMNQEQNRFQQTVDPDCHWALQNQPLMGASKPAEV
jgi:hypothetical protein